MEKVILAKQIEDEATEMRKAFCETLIELADRNPQIVLFDADLMSAMGTKPFQAKYPERTVDCGIQEANMVGMACGASILGKVPFVHTFAPFITRRAADQVFVSGVYNKANVKLIGSDPGITAALNGGTHMPFEDMGIMRGMPGMTVMEPTDTVMLRDIVKQAADIYGMFYIRLVRKNVRKVFEEGSRFAIGKAAALRSGRDVTIIASGYCVAEAMEAAQQLAGEGIEARVLNMFTWKPLDEEAVCRSARETGCIVTAENHHVINGLGSAVAECLVKNCPVPVEMVGVQDEFGEVGATDYLRERFGLTAPHIAIAVKRAMGRK